MVARGIRHARARQKRDRRRWAARTQAGCKPDGYWWDTDAADRAARFFPRFLKHSKGEWAGKTFVLSSFQHDDIIRPLFGWKRKDGSRRFREAYIEIPRKNGKSELAAGIALLLTVADGEVGAEVYSSATKKDQAKIVHNQAKNMLRQSRRLRRVANIYANAIQCPRLGSTFLPLGADASTLDGLDTHGNIIDEIHAHKNRDVYDVMVTSMGARRQPLTVVITTAGRYDETSIGWELHAYATNVLERTLDDDELFAYIAAADKDDDFTDPAVWAKANPNLGVSIKSAYLERECKKARESAAYENTFRRLHLNQWTQQVVRWLKIDAWNACPSDPIDRADLVGRPCYGGLDLSSTMDLSALCWVFPGDDDDDPPRYLWRLWMPADNLENRRDHDRAPYTHWRDAGHITATPGNVIDYGWIRKDIVDDATEFDVQAIAYDPWSAMQLAIELQDDDGLVMEQCRQGFATMNAPTKEFGRLVASGRLAHGDHPVLRWMASNVSVKQDEAGNLKPDRKASGRIDGIVAGIMATGRMMLGGDGANVYSTMGVRTT